MQDQHDTAAKDAKRVTMTPHTAAEFVTVPRLHWSEPEWIVVGTAYETDGRTFTVWLAWTDEAGGWHEWTIGPRRAKRFQSREAAIAQAMASRGHSAPAPESIRAEAVKSKEAEKYETAIASAIEWAEQIAAAKRPAP